MTEEAEEAAMKILLAVDGSEYADFAVSTVASRPWPAGSAVRILHVVPPLAFAPPFVEPSLALSVEPNGPYWPTAILDARAELKGQAERLVSDVAARVRHDGLGVSVAIREGDPRTEIANEASEWDADLIVLGSHGYTGIKRWLLGSVAQSILSHATCSVEVARRKPPPTPATT